MGGPNKAAYVTGTALLTEVLYAGVGTTYEFGTSFMAFLTCSSTDCTTLLSLFIEVTTVDIQRWSGQLILSCTRHRGRNSIHDKNI